MAQPSIPTLNPPMWPELPPYRFLDILGEGGQGRVYLAEDTRGGSRVAIKFLHGAGAFDREAILRFRREAEVSTRLAHPGICPVLASDFEASPPWIVMQYVEGRDLGQILQEGAFRPASASSEPTAREPLLAANSGSGHPANSGRGARERVKLVCRLVASTARALHAANEAGVIHRDIKPRNIIVKGDGDPVVLDFGLARTEEPDVASLTQTGDLLGTPAYMSPEQHTRKTLRVDRRTDIWSLGVVLYEALTGQHPFSTPPR